MWLLDSFLNLINGLGTFKDARAASRWHLHLLNRNDLENMYRSDWVSRKIVDAPADDATREWRRWNAAQDQIELIEEVEKSHQLQRKTRDAILRARLYGGAALVMGVDDGNDPIEPVDLDAVGRDSLQFVAVMNRYELNAGPRIYNVDSPWYTRPEYYLVAAPIFGFYNEPGLTYPVEAAVGANQGDPSRAVTPSLGTVRVHPSRVVEFCGNELPDWRLAPMGGGWGDSVLQTCEDALKAFGLTSNGAATLVNDMKVDVIKIKGFSESIATKQYSDNLIKRFGTANVVKSMVNSLLLDSEEEWQRIQTDLSGLPNLIHEIEMIMCGAGGIPMERLFSESHGRGLGEGKGTSGGGGALQNYFDTISSKQNNDYSSRMSPLDQVLIRSALGRFDPNVWYDWNPLYQQDPKSKSDIDMNAATITHKDVEMGLINEDALRQARINQLIESGVYPGLEDAIEEFGAEPEEPDVQVMWSRLAGAMQEQGLDPPDEPPQLGGPQPQKKQGQKDSAPRRRSRKPKA